MTFDEFLILKKTQEAMNEDLREIKQLLLGIPDTEEKGLCGRMKNVEKNLNNFKKHYYILAGILVGSGGAVGASVLKFLGG